MTTATPRQAGAERWTCRYCSYQIAIFPLRPLRTWRIADVATLFYKWDDIIPTSFAAMWKWWVAYGEANSKIEVRCLLHDALHKID